jgi:hypothetical protein
MGQANESSNDDGEEEEQRELATLLVGADGLCVELALGYYGVTLNLVLDGGGGDGCTYNSSDRHLLRDEGDIGGGERVNGKASCWRVRRGI